MADLHLYPTLAVGINETPISLASRLADRHGCVGASLAIDLDGAFAPRLIHAALGEYDTAIEMTLEAIKFAHKSNAKTVGREEFAAIYARRTGNAAPANPFVADNWRQIGCQYVLKKNPHERGDACEKPKNVKNGPTKNSKRGGR